MSRRTYSVSTGEDLITEHLKLVGDDVDTSIAALQATSLLFTLNRLQRAVSNLPYARMKVGNDWIMPTGKPWDFLTEEKEYSIIAKDSLGADLAAAATSATLTTGTGFDSTNGAMITYDSRGIWDYIAFGSRSGTALSSVTDVGLGNASGDDALKLYALPADFWQPVSLHCGEVSNVTRNSQGAQEYSEVDLNPGPREYAIINNFLWLYKEHAASTVTLKYQKSVTDLATITSSMTTPKELDLFFVEMLNARAFRFNGNPQVDIDRAYNEAKSHLFNAIDLCTVTMDRRVKTVRGPFRSPSI